MANWINLLIIIIITVTQGMQAVVWYNFFFRTPHPGPKEVIIANHIGFVGTFILLLPGLALLATNQTRFGWWTAVYGSAALLEIIGTIYAAKGMAIRRREVNQLVEELQDMTKRVAILRHRRELLSRG